MINLRTTEEGWSFTLSGVRYTVEPTVSNIWQLVNAHGIAIHGFDSVASAQQFVAELKYVDWLESEAKRQLDNTVADLEDALEDQ